MIMVFGCARRCVDADCVSSDDQILNCFCVECESELASVFG